MFLTQCCHIYFNTGSIEPKSYKCDGASVFLVLNCLKFIQHLPQCCCLCLRRTYKQPTCFIDSLLQRLIIMAIFCCWRYLWIIWLNSVLHFRLELFTLLASLFLFCFCFCTVLFLIFSCFSWCFIRRAKLFERSFDVQRATSWHKRVHILLWKMLVTNGETTWGNQKCKSTRRSTWTLNAVKNL